MANNVTGIFLRKEVEELRKKGEDWGLSKEQIDEAILRALGERSSSDSKNGGKTRAKKRSCFSVCLKVTVFVMLLPIFLYTALTVISVTNSSFALYIGQLTADYQYPLQRMIRFVVLPLHQFYDFTKLGAWDCMVDNPLYVPEKPDCVLCSDVKTIASRASANLTKAAFKKRFYETASPVVVRDMPGYGDTEHSFEKFMEFYHTHQAALAEDTCEFRKNGVNNESLQNIAEFLGNWKHYHPNGEIIGWKVCYGQGLRLLRSMFPRPYCIHSEGALDKWVYLLQPAHEITESSTQPMIMTEVAQGTFDNVWMAQVTGSTHVVLEPVEDCEDKCEKFEFTLKQGDVFFFSQHTWVVNFQNQGKEPAMIFTSSFA